MRIRRIIALGALTGAAIVLLGLIVPQNLTVPVSGATTKDWNPQSFWYEPWGSSGRHKGIDIFGKKGTPILAASSGLVLYSGKATKGGNFIVILGPKWRLHYYAHLESAVVKGTDWVYGGEHIGALGTSGNAQGKDPHLHYAILSLIPLPWLATLESHGWKRMFYLDPGANLG